MDRNSHTGDRHEPGAPLAESGEISASSRGLDRRTLIKRAAIGGALAWTVPIVIDSVASPAGALSCGAIYRFEFQMDAVCRGGAGTTTLAPGDYVDGDVDCWGAISPPSGYGTPTNIAAGSTTTSQCVVMTSISTSTVSGGGIATNGCDSRANNTVQATINQSCTPPAMGSVCSGTKTFLAAGYVWRTADAGCNYCRTVQIVSGVSQGVVATSSDGTNCAAKVGRDGLNYSTKTMSAISDTSINFQQPASTKGPDHSGAYQFVVGCGCN